MAFPVWVDESALVLHILAAIGLVGGGIVQVMAGQRVRAARSGHELAMWTSFARSAGLLIIGAAVVSLFTGGHLAAQVPWNTEEVSGFSRPFITLGMLGLLLLAPIGPMVGGARLRRLGESAAQLGSGALTAELREKASDAVTWGAVHSLVGVGAGFVWVMSTKPGWIEGAIVLSLAFDAGWVTGMVLARQSAQSSQAA